MTIPIVIVIGAVVSVFFGILGNFISVEITDNNNPFKVEITSHLPSTERLQQLVGILNSTAQEADKLIQSPRNFLFEASFCSSRSTEVTG